MIVSKHVHFELSFSLNHAKYVEIHRQKPIIHRQLLAYDVKMFL